MILKLAVPIEVATGRIAELKFRRLIAKDFVQADTEGWGDGYQFDLRMIANSTGIPAIQLEVLDAFDFNRAAGVIGGFTRAGPRTGGEPLVVSRGFSGSDEGTSLPLTTESSDSGSIEQ